MFENHGEDWVNIGELIWLKDGESLNVLQNSKENGVVPCTAFYFIQHGSFVLLCDLQLAAAYWMASLQLLVSHVVCCMVQLQH